MEYAFALAEVHGPRLTGSPARTIRLALWGGHEGAGIGSTTYAREHAANREKPIAYFSLDNGGGKIRGVYLSIRDEHLRPVFERWLASLGALRATTVIPIREPSGSDHATFYRAGLRGFMFVQDPLEYRTRTRHSNMNVYDYTPAGGHAAGGRRRRGVHVSGGDARVEMS